ncbi:beta/alpha barrel domain-containing protein [Woodsholea maritima]|uniref:hypothetical protein n=1 Tax=Woodsholea maritima TaxID=240237 RepID=UPI0003624DFD|nr:hypothetical protein [Woodsholea maritima]
MTRPTPILLDCTLRDGSYQVEFGFSAAHTHALVTALEDAGISWIEVGHGLGLGAYRSDKARAAETDQGYIEAARMAAKEAKIGVFSMPAFATQDDISAAADFGIDFIRCGIDAAHFERAEPFVRHAKSLGLHTTLFLMKSYTLDTEVLSQHAPRFEDWGADAIAIVDSAGGLLPAMVRDYVGTVRLKTTLDIAFHGHNNLQLAVGNALAAYEAGATIFDCSLAGLGRSAGNAPIEALAAAFRRMGLECANPVHLAEIAHKFVRPEDLPAPDVRVDLVQGLALVHSGMQGKIDRIALAAGLHPAALTLAAGAHKGGLDLTEDELHHLALTLKADKERHRA